MQPTPSSSQKKAQQKKQEPIQSSIQQSFAKEQISTSPLTCDQRAKQICGVVLEQTGHSPFKCCSGTGNPRVPCDQHLQRTSGNKSVDLRNRALESLYYIIKDKTCLSRKIKSYSQILLYFCPVYSGLVDMNKPAKT
ncbi:hypothetical protein F2P81_012055 [Scophthalmus maximus]|uniref:Uncharacterized protein n=1 Tax=Scophthalmus maximus TaxID=52904 RepID=A0A6A4SRW4_SCOMX|nr:hypothetical protein F2P81_012055 [Scophthalmus maximus]